MTIKQLKPRNKQLNEWLRATKSERHEAKAGRLIKRAKAEQLFRRELKGWI